MTKMKVDGEPSMVMPLPEKVSVTLTFESVTFSVYHCNVDVLLSNCDQLSLKYILVYSFTRYKR